MSVYEFLGRIIAAPLDETLLFNVSDSGFWEALRPKLENARTFAAFHNIEKAVAKISDIAEEKREAALNIEYGKMFCGEHPVMPAVESAYGMQAASVLDVAAELGVESSLPDNLPAEHLAFELLMLSAVEEGRKLDASQLAKLADFFEKHPIALANAMVKAAPANACKTTGFYQAIVQFAAAWLQWDLDAFEQAS